MHWSWSGVRAWLVAIGNTPIKAYAVIVLVIAAVVLSTVWHDYRDRRLSLRGTNQEVGLGNLVQSIRRELLGLQSDRRNQGYEALFSIESFDLEVAFVVRNTTKVGGGIEAEVVTLETSSEAARERSHKVTLHLKPLPTQELTVSPSSSVTSEGEIQMLPPVHLSK